MSDEVDRPAETWNAEKTITVTRNSALRFATLLVVRAAMK